MCLNSKVDGVGTLFLFVCFLFYLHSNWKAKKKATVISRRHTYLLCIFLSEQRWKVQISNIAQGLQKR